MRKLSSKRLEKLRARERVSSAKWRASHPERAYESAKKWRLANPWSSRKRSAKWIKSHPEYGRAKAAKFRAKHADKARAWALRWKSLNRGRVYESNAARRALKKGMLALLSCDEKRKIAEIYTACATLSKNTGRAYHVDHKIPLAKGGRHAITNLQILPALENLRKGVRI